MNSWRGVLRDFFYKYTQNPAEKNFISSNEDVVRYKYLDFNIDFYFWI
jgi:hypothetical protein